MSKPTPKPTVGIGTTPTTQLYNSQSNNTSSLKPTVGIGTTPKPTVGIGTTPTTQLYNSQSKK